MVLRDHDVAPRQLAQIVRYRAVRGDAPLEEDPPAGTVQQQLPHAVEDRARLRAARPREEVADRDAVLELVDRRGRKDRADGAELGRGVVVDLPRNLLHRHAEFRRHAVEVAARPRRAHAGHHRRPEVHLRVEHHALGVLPAAVDDRVHVWIEELRPRDVRRHLAHLEVERNETVRVIDDLTARHDRRRHVLEREPRLLEEIVRRLAHRAHAAVPAPTAPPRAGEPPRIDRLRALIRRRQHLPALREDDGLVGRRTDVYA